ncbi:uncharacterized protein LOC131969951 [Centropristis striata]|uniref:uncharacterized protein LOC131969951 n=1 Tax=Centropristis striata TaxID=184440 RepID=UPI0027E052C0|nr:uncharacterized protein LOC131969951 [Centropristis striata]
MWQHDVTILICDHIPCLTVTDPAGGFSLLAERFHSCLLRGAGGGGGGTMIDLSHLTEEEQGVIMSVLRRDADLKKAEEERIRKLEKILVSGSQPDTELKYLTGEWFYEAKSRRHMDKIHGSEIILASMKPRKAGLDGSLRMERSKTPSSRGSDTGPPPKPARCWDALQPQEINDAEKENLNSAVRSPRTPRHNPFNRASLIVVEPPENNDDTSASRDQASAETEPIFPLKSHPAEASQTPGGSITSESSSLGFRPVPKKRTFLSRRTSRQSESSSLLSDPQGESAEVVPAPRQSLQRGSSESSNQSNLKDQDEKPKSVASNQQSPPAQPSRALDENSQQPLREVSQVSSNSSLERERPPPSITRDRPATNTRSDVSADREMPLKSDERDDRTQREHAAMNAVVLHPGSIQSSGRGNNSSVGTTMRQGELSLPQSTVDADPPVSYDLNYIDKSDHQTQRKTNQKNAFQLSTQTSSPTGDEEDSIAKVLDWFSRSTDSLDWLKTEDGPKATKTSDKREEISKVRSEDSLRKDAGDIQIDRTNETLEMRRNHLQRQANEAKELRATDRETQEEVKEDNRDRMPPQGVKDNNDESQQAPISHLKSFWEKSNTGPKILISKSITPGDKGQKPGHLSAEKDEEKVNKSHKAPDIPSVPGIYNGKGIYDKSASNHGDEREQQRDIGGSVHLNYNQEDSTYNSDYLKVAASPQVADRRGSDTEILSVTRLNQQPRTPIQSSPVPESISRETSLLDDEMTIPASQLDTDPDYEKLYLSRNSPYMDYKQSDVQVTPKTQMRRGSSEDVKRTDSEDKSGQSSRISSPHPNRPSLPHQDSTAEKIKQLKSFWEQEWSKPKPKALGDGKVARGANQSKLNKRYTKSEYDLTSVGNDSGSDAEDRNHHNFTVLPLNQRIDKSSPSLGASRAQFNTLREFWGEAASDNKGSFGFDKPKSPKRKEPVSTQLSSQDPEVYSVSEKTRSSVMKSSPPPQNRSKSPHDRQTGSRAANDGKNNLSNYTESKRSSKDSNREEKSTKSQISSGKEIRSPTRRKDSFSNSSSRGNTMRRATSMFALSVPDEKELKMDVSPVHSQSRKQRQNAGASPRRSPEETPRARACVPRDFRHYLGMTDKTSVHTSLAPAVKDEGSEGYDFDMGGPVRASTPVSSEERYSRKGSKMSQRPLWANYSSSDAGQESSVSSTSETWSNSRTSSNREHQLNFFWSFLQCNMNAKSVFILFLRLP